MSPKGLFINYVDKSERMSSTLFSALAEILFSSKSQLRLLQIRALISTFNNFTIIDGKAIITNQCLCQGRVEPHKVFGV